LRYVARLHASIEQFVGGRLGYSLDLLPSRTGTRLRTSSTALAQASIQLDHQPVLNGHAPVHARRDVHVVGGDDHGEAGGLHQLGERGEHVLGGARVEVSGGLVGQQNARRVGDRARDRYALLLAAGKFRRTIICGMITFSIAENSISR
jgi:hypothetical protein